jgi:hypothetical protein
MRPLSRPKAPPIRSCQESGNSTMSRRTAKTSQAKPYRSAANRVCQNVVGEGMRRHRPRRRAGILVTNE